VSEPKASAGMALLVTAVVVTLAGCGRVAPLPGPYPGRSLARPGLSASPGDGASAEPDGPSAGTPEPAGPTPTAGALPDAGASACAGRPSVGQVTTALRQDRNLRSSSGTPRVVTGPLCTGSWQYTVLDFPGNGVLQVVTRGSGDSLTVVTAGTYVCIPEVVGGAPAGIVSAAHCR
jgi:hypothetical protein